MAIPNLAIRMTLLLGLWSCAGEKAAAPQSSSEFSADSQGIVTEAKVQDHDGDILDLEAPNKSDMNSLNKTIQGIDRALGVTLRLMDQHPLKITAAYHPKQFIDQRSSFTDANADLGGKTVSDIQVCSTQIIKPTALEGAVNLVAFRYKDGSIVMHGFPPVRQATDLPDEKTCHFLAIEDDPINQVELYDIEGQLSAIVFKTEQGRRLAGGLIASGTSPALTVPATDVIGFYGNHSNGRLQSLGFVQKGDSSPVLELAPAQFRVYLAQIHSGLSQIRSAEESEKECLLEHDPVCKGKTQDDRCRGQFRAGSHFVLADELTARASYAIRFQIKLLKDKVKDLWRGNCRDRMENLFETTANNLDDAYNKARNRFELKD